MMPQGIPGPRRGMLQGITRSPLGNASRHHPSLKGNLRLQGFLLPNDRDNLTVQASLIQCSLLSGKLPK